jgi:hypothetical protein
VPRYSARLRRIETRQLRSLAAVGFFFGARITQRYCARPRTKAAGCRDGPFFREDLSRALVTSIGPRLFSLTKATEPLAGHQRLCLPSRMLMD